MSKGKLIRNKIIRNDRVKTISSHFDDLKKDGVRIQLLTPYQYRFTKGKHKIDYYPTSGKYFDISLQRWDSIPADQIMNIFSESAKKY